MWYLPGKEITSEKQTKYYNSEKNNDNISKNTLYQSPSREGFYHLQWAKFMAGILF